MDLNNKDHLSFHWSIRETRQPLSDGAGLLGTELSLGSPCSVTYRQEVRKVSFPTNIVCFTLTRPAYRDWRVWHYCCRTKKSQDACGHCIIMDHANSYWQFKCWHTIITQVWRQSLRIHSKNELILVEIGQQKHRVTTGIAPAHEKREIVWADRWHLLRSSSRVAFSFTGSWSTSVSS